MSGCPHPHPPDCLCDVVIVTPTPVNYSFHEVAMAGAIANAIGWREGDNLADLLEPLAEAAERRPYDVEDETWVIPSHVACRWLLDHYGYEWTADEYVARLAEDGHRVTKGAVLKYRQRWRRGLLPN